MPLPALALPALAAGGLSSIIVKSLTVFFLAKGPAVVIRIFSMLGIAYAAYNFVLQPLISQATSSWQGVPASLKQWIGAFGIDMVASIMISAYGIWALKKLVLQLTT